MMFQSPVANIPLFIKKLIVLSQRPIEDTLTWQLLLGIFKKLSAVTKVHSRYF